ncbi:MAG: hypothetical protein E7402_04380 [Ruminococcaceae bacterium]|nr:hypothetical protein [Oscillospiraceae bacterium]
MKRKMMKVMVTCVVFALVACMQLSAFAAVPSYTANTVHNGDGTATVTLSNIQGVEASEEVAFYATTQDGDVAWIDQVSGADIDGTYSFKLSAALVAQNPVVSLRVGDSNDGAGSAFVVEGSYTVAVSTDGNGYVVAAGDAEPAASADVTGDCVLSLYCYPNAGYEVASYQIDEGEAVTNFVLGQDGKLDITVKEDCAVRVNFAALDVTDQTADVIEGTGALITNGLEVISKIQAGSAKEFGIIVAEEEIDSLTYADLTSYKLTDNVEHEGNIHAFSALACGSDGRFSVQVLDGAETDYFTDKTLYVYVYAANGDGDVDFAPVVLD